MRGWFALVWMLGLLMASLAKSPVEMRVIPLFGQTVAPDSPYPIAVELRSQTSHLKGMLIIRRGDFSGAREYRYPVELPAGSRKVIVTSPVIEDFAGSIEVVFQAGRHTFSQTQPITVLHDLDSLVVSVGDVLGGLQYLTRIPNSRKRLIGSGSQPDQGKYQPAYCPPERFPESAMALSGVSFVMLHPGAERLNAEQWNALRQWVVLGGTLIVPGGAGALYLQQPTVRALLPVQVERLVRVPNLRALEAFAKAQPLDQLASITQAKHIEGKVLLQQDNLPLIVVRPYGFGVVVFLAFYPNEEPLRSYKGISAFWQGLLSQLPDETPSKTIRQIFLTQSGTATDQTSPSTDDLKLEIPGLALISTLLVIYFFLVVPINYWVLKRFRALDWAWVSTPIIAFVFVGILSRFTADLYRKPLSATIQSVILMPAGATEAYAVNSALFFFPRAGVYDLRFDRSEMVEVGTPSRDFRGGSDILSVVATLEGEPKIIQNYRVRNLSFQWFRYTRYIDLGGQVVAKLRIKHDGRFWRLDGHIENRLPFALKWVNLRIGDNTIALGDLESRAKKTIRQKVPIPRPFLNLQSENPQIVVYPWGTSEYEIENLSLEGVFAKAQAMWYQRLPDVPIAYLIANASEPVLSPELESATRSQARNTICVCIPVEKAP